MANERRLVVTFAGGAKRETIDGFAAAGWSIEHEVDPIVHDFVHTPMAHPPGDIDSYPFPTVKSWYKAAAILRRV